MLARKAVGAQVKPDIYVGSQRREASFVFDFSPMMKQIVSWCLVLLLFIVVLSIINSLCTKVGYEVVKVQQNIVQLTKDNDILEVEVSTLKSPVRIQKIAEEKLGMVLPSSFVYSTKSTTVERNVKMTSQIVD